MRRTAGTRIMSLTRSSGVAIGGAPRSGEGRLCCEVLPLRIRISPREEPLEVRLHATPIGPGDAVDHARPDAPVVRDAVVTHLTLLDRADALHRALRSFVQLVCLEPDAIRAEVLEQVAQLQVLRLGIR